MERAGDGTDYLGPALLLASDAGKYMTGQVVDGRRRLVRLVTPDGTARRRPQASADEINRCVYSWVGLFEDLIGLAFLDDEAVLHDLDPLGQVADEPQVVRDEDHRQAALGLDPPQQVEDGRLGRLVER